MKRLLTLIKPTGTREIFIAIFAWIHFLLVDLMAVGGLYFWFHNNLSAAAVPEGGYRIWLPTLLQDLSVNYPGAAAFFKVKVLLVCLLIFLLSLFLHGAVYSTLADGSPFKPLDFMKRGARYFARMFRLALASLPLWGILALIPGLLFRWQKMTQDTSPSEELFYIFAALWVPLTLFILMVGKSAFDYARIHLVSREAGVIASLKGGLISLWKNRAMTLLLFLVYYIFTGVVLFLSTLPAPETALVLLLALHQLSVLVRYFGKVLLMKGEVELIGTIESEEPEKEET